MSSDDMSNEFADTVVGDHAKMEITTQQQNTALLIHGTTTSTPDVHSLLQRIEKLENYISSLGAFIGKDSQKILEFTPEKHNSAREFANRLPQITEGEPVVKEENLQFNKPDLQEKIYLIVRETTPDLISTKNSISQEDVSSLRISNKRTLETDIDSNTEECSSSKRICIAEPNHITQINGETKESDAEDVSFQMKNAEFAKLADVVVNGFNRVEERLEIMQDLVKEVMVVKQGVIENGALLQKILDERISFSKDSLSTLSYIFPLCDEEELNSLEEQIKINEPLLNQTVKALLQVGGNDVTDFVKRVMPQVVSNKFAQRCNLSGKNGKVCLKNTSVFRAIFMAATQNRPTANCTERDVEADIRKWLTGARDREGGKRHHKRQPGLPHMKTCLQAQIFTNNEPETASPK